ncbi:MAG: DNA-binding response regulator [Novosphingobium sp. 17-62-19]|uniref:DNA-binding response regulator n=1 Tax=Novosphingobium sp. 17-62-19 TaxID=1970406 RepID=UPI000BDDE4C5|nr:response regulator [Novosphingobium sp. 17-62-19]OZA21264.1 MAG: DNA-binding response regulator [Novosphingobium sp. 17-62-19]HQS96544.1 response regulator [Novosphingobium sp.]
MSAKDVVAGRDTVLVVDDNPESLHFLIDTIERAGMTVLIATNGNDALELLEHAAPDLILIDAIMPGLDGFDTTRAIKKQPRLADIPVIFMTGLTETEHAVRALEAGGVDYVRKPIAIEELLARMRVHLTAARVSQAGRSALDATGRHLFAVTPGGDLLWATPQVERLLETLGSADALPAEFAQPLARLMIPGENPGTSLRFDAGGQTIELVLVGPTRGEEVLVRLNVIREGAEVELLRERYGLTLREAEVLLWISYGKPNRVISEILGISPRTVNKHLEQVFEKLGVETRAAAAAFAVRTIT